MSNKLLAPFATVASLDLAATVRKVPSVCAEQLLQDFLGGQHHCGQEGVISVPRKCSQPPWAMNIASDLVTATTTQIFNPVNIYLAARD